MMAELSLKKRCVFSKLLDNISKLNSESREAAAGGVVCHVFYYCFLQLTYY